MDKIRVMTYNVLDGLKEDPDRQNRLCEWIAEQDPEIVALQELCRFSENDLKRLAARWGHRHVAILKEEGYPVGLTSKRPIKVVRRVTDGFTHGMLHIRTYGMDLIVTHLSPCGIEQRQKEAEYISDYILSNNLDRCLLMGDMNAVSPFDADHLDRPGFPDFSVISKFLSIGMDDECRRYVLPAERSTFPTPVLADVSKHDHVREKTAERIDFIFSSRKLSERVVDAFVWKNEVTGYLSDHYPTGIDLRMEMSQNEGTDEED